MEILSPARLGICCFRPHPKGQHDSAALEALTLRVMERVNANGRFFLSTTRLNGILAIRICTCGWRTSEQDITSLIEELREEVVSGEE
jgi:aromatic-L-amino-acid/L-tryptophan decarboxylase